MSEFPVRRQSWPVGSPNIIWKARWAGNGIFAKTALETSVHSHAGSRYDGCFSAPITDEYIFGSHSIMAATTKAPSSANGFLFDPVLGQDIFHNYNGTPVGFQMAGTNRYGHPGNLIRTPRMIRLIHRAGWFGMEHYPMFVIPSDDGFPVEEFESLYLPPVDPGEVEIGCIDYQEELGNKLVDYCKQHGIMFSVMSQDQTGSNFLGQYEHGPGGLDMSQHPLWYQEDNSGFFRGHIGHPARWLNNLHPYYPFPDSFNEFGLASLKPSVANLFPRTWDAPKMVVCGEILNIIFVTDGFSAYHGVNWEDYGDSAWAMGKSEGDAPFQTGSKEALQVDIDRCRDVFKRCRHYGNIVVHSPKNAEFFGLFCKDINAGEGFGIPYCLTEAQRHLDEVADKMKDLNTKILIRRYKTRPVEDGDHHSGTPIHLDWEGEQVSVEDIMTLVQDFWQEPGTPVPGSGLP